MDASLRGAGFFTQDVAHRDAALHAAMADELTRQRDEIELIASENIVSRAVLQAEGSVLTNKYAEGYPGRRYYGGCQHVDVAEQIAIERACQLFGAKFANVQPIPARRPTRRCSSPPSSPARPSWARTSPRADT